MIRTAYSTLQKLFRVAHGNAHSKKRQERYLTIASTPWVVNNENKGWFVKDRGSSQWQRWTLPIHGFHYELSYEYEVLVSKDFTPDATVPNYSLVRIFTKTQKNSRNLPQPLAVNS